MSRVYPPPRPACAAQTALPPVPRRWAIAVIDIDVWAASVARALPEAEPCAAVALFVEQVRWLDDPAAPTLVDAIVTRAHPSTWEFDDDLLDTWSPAAAGRALAAVRALRDPEDRIEALLRVLRRLSGDERDEVLRAVVDGTFLPTTYRHSKPMGRHDLIAAFLRTTPTEDRERWVRAEVGRYSADPLWLEFDARREAGCLDERAVRDLWARMMADDPRHIPVQLLPFLPSDLRQQALATFRACADDDTRLSGLATYDDELTDDERRAVVEVPPNRYTRDDPLTQAKHLREVARHLPRVAPEVRRRWLERILAIDYPYARQLGLLHLLPHVSGDDHATVVAALLASLEEGGQFYGAPRWDVVPGDRLPAMLVRLRDDPYAWHRDGLVAHISRHRAADVADRVLPLLLDGLDERAPDARLEIARALTPWLADRTAGAAPRALAALTVPRSDEPADALYMVARVIRTGAP